MPDPQTEQRRPGGETEAAQEVRWAATTSTSIAETVDYAEHFTARCIQDAINAGLATTWERRRAAFLAARPRPGDFCGAAHRDELRARWHELTRIADACRARAAVSLGHEDIDPDVWEAIAC